MSDMDDIPGFDDPAGRAHEEIGEIENFPDEDFPVPLTDALGQDPMQLMLADGFRMQERLRASRDSEAIKRSNLNTLAFLEAMNFRS